MLFRYNQILIKTRQISGLVLISQVYLIISMYRFDSMNHKSWVYAKRPPSPQIRPQTPQEQIYWQELHRKQAQISPCSYSAQKERSVIGVRLHLTHQDETSMQDLNWLKQQFSEANRLFKQINVCFKVIHIQAHSSSDWHMKTRKQRTQLGYDSGQVSRLKKGQIDLFIVGRLDDVDRENTQIRGVHWRDPAHRRSRRWIILSRIAQPKVLAHELGHYFSLPHSKYTLSIMNKTPRDVPIKKRGFVKQELRQMRIFYKKMRQTAHLVPL